jgi:putative chitinase
MSLVLSATALRSADVPGPQVHALLEPLRASCAKFKINTPRRLAAFLANLSHESAGLTVLQENLFYTTPERIMAVFPSRVKTLEIARPLARNPRALANFVYSGRLGNGGIESDEGWMYRGRGGFQLTGKTNYLEAGMALDRPYLTQPELVALPFDACETSAWFWASRGCNELADGQMLEAITRRINGPALLGHKHRVELYHKAIPVLNWN